jgi:transcription elongation factor SPT6
LNVSVRQAVSLGRFLQNPLAEVLEVWHDDINSNRCLSINLHPLQQQVSKKRLVERLEIEAVKAVNLIGVDVNRVKAHNHLVKQLQFVSGLGPRKAAYLLEKVTLTGELINRKDVIPFFGNTIYHNMLGFLKVKMYVFFNSSISNHNQNSAYSEKDKRHINTDNAKIEAVMNKPDLLLVLDLNESIKKNEDLGNFNFQPLMKFIERELTEPFKDPRSSFRELSDMEIFKLMTLENPIDIGHIVLAKSIKVGKNQVFCKLENDLEATLFKNDIFEDNNITINNEEVEDKMNQLYPKNSLFYARVKSINKQTFKVELVTRRSKMISHKGEDLGPIDQYFQIDEEVDLKNELFTQNENNDQKNKKYVKRNINHPNFKNFNYSQCLDFLSNREIGSYIFRPSSRSADTLTLSWKFYDNVISHISITEEDKAKGASVGTKLRISNDIYTSLHEIADRFLNPCRRIVLDAISNRKFVKFESFDLLESKLKQDKLKDPMIIHYVFTISKSYPQFIILAYTPKPSQVIKEFMKVKPRGLFFHDNYFNDLNDVAKYFKDNYSKEDYKNYVRKVKIPGEDNFETANNFTSQYNNSVSNINNINSMSNTNNINSGVHSYRNDYNSGNYLGSKRVKSPFESNKYSSNNYSSIRGKSD